MSVKDEMQEMVESLKQERDEIRLQLNLLKKEARDEWDELDDSWHKFRVKVSEVADAGEQAGSDVFDALKLLGSEINDDGIAFNVKRAASFDAARDYVGFFRDV